MELFRKPEVCILKESNTAEAYSQQLEELLPKAKGDTAKVIEKEIFVTKAGIAGENTIMYELKNSGMDLVVLHDLYLETASDTSAQIDFFVITNKLIFILECKNLFGNIEVNSKGDFIRTIQYGNKYYKEGIYSPITQNERHLQVIKDKRVENNGRFMRAFLNTGFDNIFKSLVVLANPKTVVNDKYAKKEVKDKIVRADQLISTMKSMNKASNEPKYSPKDMKMIGEKWLSRCVEHNDERILKFEQMIQEDTKEISENDIADATEEKICPRCGHPLILREAKRGEHVGEKFWGCSNYPHCRFIEKV